MKLSSRPFFSWLAAFIIRAVGASIRVTVEDNGRIVHQPVRGPVIIAFWHNRVVLLAYYCSKFVIPDRDVFIFISRSRDGQFIADVAARLGIRSVRGSSSRHGTAAALTAVRAADDPEIDLAITPDGPRGPRYQIQPGLLRIAAVTGRPIVAVTYSMKWKFELRSWDRFHVPIPFASCRLVTSKPIFVPEHAADAEISAITASVTKALGGD